MSKNNYDDIFEKRNQARRREGNSRLLIITIILALLLFGLAFLIWVSFVKTSASEVKQTETASTPLVGPDYSLPETVTVSPGSKTETETSEPETQESAEASTPVAHSLDSVAALRNDQAEPVLYCEVTVEHGQTISTIAQNNGLTAETLVSVNSITGPLAENTVILVPTMDGMIHTVKSGDTLSSIVQQYSLSVSWKALMEINSLNDDNLTEGQKIFIPKRYLTSSEKGTKEQSLVPVEFISPLDGTSVADRIRMEDGYLFTTSETADVVAAMDGSVVDISFDSENSCVNLKLAHQNGYTSKYCYLSPKIEVSITDKVEKGQKLGTVDSYLLFIVEKDGKAIL